MELWDVYDGKRRPTGQTHVRGKALREGENHIVVGVIVYNSKGEIFVTRRSLEKISDGGK